MQARVSKVSAITDRSGLTFADVLILLAIVLLLAALAIPKFVKATDYGNEEDEVLPDAAAQSTLATNAPSTPDAP